MVGKFLGVVAAITAALAVSTPALAQGDDVRVVVKFVKADGATGPVAVFDPSSCPTCVLVQDPEYARENGHETLIDLRVPRRRTLDLAFDAPAGGVRRVVLETGDIAFTQVGGRLTVHLPPLIDDAVNAGEFHTNIVEPGMVVRIEHDDPARRAGAYADVLGDFMQRRAADVLTFAQREAVRQLGIGQAVERDGLGKILIMGFDTNFPHGHTDAPAHMHMHMRWPDNAGTQISHYYIDERGLLVRNEVGIQLLNAPQRIFGPGETFTTIDRRGRPAYSHTITAEGWLALADALGQTCVVRPVETGFQSGAVVSCPGRPEQTIQVQDDVVDGVLRVRTGRIEEVFRYDIDTGALMSAKAPPDASPSGYPPGR
jgi:hypothetical protein